MNRRTWPLLLAAFTALICLTAAFGLAVSSVLVQTRDDTARLQAAASQRETILRDLRADVYALAILLRDRIIAGPAGPGLDLVQSRRASLRARLASLKQALAGEHPDALTALEREAEAYGALVEQTFSWSAAEVVERGRTLLGVSGRPHREAALSLTRQISQINARVLDDKRAEIIALQDATLARLRAGVAAVVVLALLIAGAAFSRISSAEALADRRGGELRDLSRKLVRAQEEERRNLSRELHDEVGQILTALRMELGNLGGLRAAEGPAFQTHLDEAKRLAEATLAAVREMARGLRPAVLDDLGLGAALRWQTREFSKRTGVAAECQLSGDFESFDEQQRTGLFRIVQEALTNCARHARARNVHVALSSGPRGTTLEVRDDGDGFEPGRHKPDAMGLVGIEERVRDLRGKLAVLSAPGRGAVLRVELPGESAAS